jgi:hypothetical protein
MAWEGIEWTRTPLVSGPGHCDGCDSERDSRTVYTATDPEGAKVRALWCDDCIQQAGSYQG